MTGIGLASKEGSPYYRFLGRAARAALAAPRVFEGVGIALEIQVCSITSAISDDVRFYVYN